MARDECGICVLRCLCIAPVLSSVPLGVAIPQLLCALCPTKGLGGQASVLHDLLFPSVHVALFVFDPLTRSQLV